MKIGVDARILSGPICGIRRYAECLLAEMQKCGHDWYLYLPSPSQEGAWSAGNVNVRCGSVRSPWLRVLWGHTVLPAMAARDGVDLLWSPSHRLPRLLPKRLRTVVTIHDLVWLRFPDSMSPFTRALDRLEMPRTLKIADRVISVSQATGHELVEFFPDVGRKLSVVHEGPVLSSDERESSVSSLPLAVSDYLLCVGTLEPRKNFARTIAAFARLVRDGHHTGLALVIAGRRGWGEDLAALTESLGVADYVHILGEIDSGALATLYRNARGFLMPSLYEGFGLPLLEAMYFGVPILTSGRSAMQEVAGDCAVLVDPESVDSIHQGILRLIGKNGLAARLKQCGNARIGQFSWQKAARETLEVFEKAMSSE